MADIQGIIGTIVLRETDFAVPILEACEHDLRKVGLRDEAGLISDAIGRILEVRRILTKGDER